VALKASGTDPALVAQRTSALRTDDVHFDVGWETFDERAAGHNWVRVQAAPWGRQRSPLPGHGLDMAEPSGGRGFKPTD
jgi:allantoicase